MAGARSAPQPVVRTGTIATLAARLGVTPSRIVLQPGPGLARVEDVETIRRTEGRLCELIDGVLVEKVMGFDEGLLGSFLVHLLWQFVREHDLGIVQGEGGLVRLLPEQVRIPDVAFYSWARLPGRRSTGWAIPPIAPDLAVEVLSPSNTATEMDRKLLEYFAAGCRLVWYLDPAARSVRVFRAVDRVEVVDETGVLDGEAVLPGFRLAVADWLNGSGYGRPEAGE